MRRPMFRAAGVGLLVLAFVLPAGAQESVNVTVIHAVPAEDGFPADVYLNGDMVIDGMVFETRSDPLAVEPGVSELSIYPQGADPVGDDPVAQDELSFEAGLDYSIVAQVIEGEPALALYQNDTGRLDAGQSRLTVRQASSLPEVAVVLDGERLSDPLGAADETTTVVDAGDHALEIGPPPGDEPLVEQALDLGEGELTVLYAVDATDAGSLSLLVQTLPAAAGAPAGVPTGTGGAKAGGDLALPLALGTLAATSLFWSRWRATARR